MKPGDIYRHSGNQNTYTILMVAKLKNNQTRKWEEAVVYQESNTIGTIGAAVYVREQRDFKRKFVAQIHP